MKHPNFDKLYPLFESGEDFSLTEAQYKQSTGVSLPKNNRYLQQESALARIAKENGYKVVITERTVSLKKTS